MITTWLKKRVVQAGAGRTKAKDLWQDFVDYTGEAKITKTEFVALISEHGSLVVDAKVLWVVGLGLRHG
jgi:hypothetical protein